MLGATAFTRMPAGAAVDPERDPAHLDHLGEEEVGERQGEVAVGDRPAEGRFRVGPVHVDVDPLVVSGGVGERVDLLLGHLDPRAVAEVPASRGADLLDALEGGDCHVFLVSAVRPDRQVRRAGS